MMHDAFCKRNPGIECKMALGGDSGNGESVFTMLEEFEGKPVGICFGTRVLSVGVDKGQPKYLVFDGTRCGSPAVLMQSIGRLNRQGNQTGCLAIVLSTPALLSHKPLQDMPCRRVVA